MEKATIFRLQSYIEPTGRVINGSAIKVNTDIPGDSKHYQRLYNFSDDPVTVTVVSYNGHVYSDSSKTTERSISNIIEDDGNGNTIREYDITVNPQSNISFYENESTWILLKNNKNSVILSSGVTSGVPSSLEYRRYNVNIQDALTSVDKNLITAVNFAYCKNVTEYDIADLINYPNAYQLYLAGCRGVTGDVGILSNLSNDVLTKLDTAFSNTDIYGELSAVLDATGAAFVEAGIAEPVTKLYRALNTRVTLNGVKITSDPSVRFNTDGSWEVV